MKKLIEITRHVEAVLIEGTAQPTSNPYLFYMKWGQAMLEIKPFGDLTGYPAPKFFRRRKRSKQRYYNRVHK